MITKEEAQVQAKAAILKVASVYGKEHAKVIERLSRNETSHYSSGNFLQTYGCGMESTKDTFPYGWSQAEQFWLINPQYHPTGIYAQIENSSVLAKASKKPKQFIIFPSIEASFMTVSHIIKVRGGNGGTWFSKNAVEIKKYADYLETIKTHFV